MTVKELINKLSTLPEDKPIRISVYDYVNCVYNTEDLSEIDEDNDYINLY